MTLRTPNPYRSYQTHLNLQRSKERLGILQEQLTTDKRITRLSDDPTAAALIMDFQYSIERNSMYVKQGETATSFLKGTESALNSIFIQIERLLELGQQGLSDLTGEKGREAIAAEVDGLRTIVLDMANTKEQGKYLFAGTMTKLPAGVLPFAWDTTQPTLPNGSLDWANMGTPPGTPPYHIVDYNGNAGNIDLDISVTASVTTNLTGEYVFLGGAAGAGTDEDIFVAITKLRDGLLNNDSDMILEGYNAIMSAKDRINVCLTTVGARQLSTENTGYNLGDMNETLQSIQNTYESIDYPWTITQFAAEQTSQQASLSVLAKMGKNSLFDYIG